jgi:hypothetical protein
MERNFRRTLKLAVLLGSFLLLVSLFMSVQTGTAWKNGSYANTYTSYSYTSHYSTHDWVAEAALDALVSVDAGNWQWLVDRKTIFLVGTEAPDNAGVSMTLDGTAITGSGAVTDHHIYYNADGTTYEDNAAIEAKLFGNLADAAMDEQKRDLAAFYLGAMTHYIADLGSFAHVIDGVDTSDHDDFEGYVNTRTNDHADRESFFKISPVTVTSKTPYNAAKDLGWDTYKDPTSAHGAQWLWDNLFSGWKQTLETRAEDTTNHQTYYNRVEQNLNNAVAACAAAMNGGLGIGSSGATDGLPGYPLPIFGIFTIIGVMSLIGRKYRKSFA